jgi:hypothetical protein
MVSIETNKLNATNVTTKVLRVVEDVCQQFGLNKDFGYISLSSQIIAEYLSSYNNTITINFSVYIETETLTLTYSTNQTCFSNFLVEFKEIEALRLMSDSIDVSAGNKTLSLNFHVKPKPNYLNQNKLKEQNYQNTLTL